MMRIEWDGWVYVWDGLLVFSRDAWLWGVGETSTYALAMGRA